MTIDQTIPWTIADILSATRGDLLSGPSERSFAGVEIDSRRITADAAFVAIVGAVHDGHRFCDDVLRQGVQGLIVNRDHAVRLPIDDWRRRKIACVAVADTTRALGHLATFNRQRAGINVIAVTGSNGKTTTRKFTAAVVGRKYKTLATRGNLNNAIGLPLTLMRLTPAHQWAVLELGTNHPGEIADLAVICRPDIGVITNIAPAHLEGLGSLEGVMRAKGELLHELKPGGKAVLNADDPRCRQLAQECRKSVILFGTGSDADVSARDIRDSAAGVNFELAVSGERISVTIQIPGRFMVANALAAAAVGHLLALPLETIKAGLETVVAESGRMAVIPTDREITIVDDAYNANPASMQAAFSALGAMRGRQRSALVLGDMLELGENAAGWHRRIAAAAAQSGAKRIYFAGEFAGLSAQSARAESMDSGDIHTGDHQEILADLKQWLRPGDWVLVKGSRGMRMDKIVAELKEWAGELKDRNH